MLRPAARPRRSLVDDRGRDAPSASTGWLCPGRSPAPAGLAATHGSSHTVLLFRSELENIIDEQPRVILVITLECGWRRTGEYPMVVLALEQTGGHCRAGANGLRIDNPAFHPVGFQAFAGQQKIGRRGSAIMGGIAGRVTFEARRRGAGEQDAPQFRFLRRQRGRPFRGYRERLPREGRAQAL